MTIEIVSPRADWPEAYSALATRIRSAVPPGSRLHHIGSTAVPNLVAKDVIDMQMSVAGLDAIDAGALSDVGFVERPGLCDHAPPGRDLPPQECAKRFFASTGRPANLHVRVFDRFNQRYPLLCRDYLRAHPVAAAAYGVFKLRLAALTDDRGVYADAKDPVFDLIMVGAEVWARQTGWRESPEDW